MQSHQNKDLNNNNPKLPLWRRRWIKAIFFFFIIAVTRNFIIPYLHPTLHRAVQQNNLSKIKELHKKGHDLNALDSRGWAPIHDAIMNNSTNSLEFLLKLGADVDSKTREKKATPLILAVIKQKKSHVKLLLQHNAKVNFEATQGGSALRLAVEKNNLEITELLLQHNAKIETYAPDGFNILHFAIQTNQPAMVELLLKYNSNIKTPAKLEVDTPPLHLATCYGHEKIAAILIKHGSDVNEMVGNSKDEMAPLHIAAENGNSVLGVLLENGAKTEIFTKSGLTPLHLAVSNNNFESVKLLIRHKANINVIAKDKLRHTPLCLAIQHDNAKMVSLLISLGVDINIPLSKNFSHLMYASVRNNLEICNILIQNGADVNKSADHNVTPLHSAIVGKNKNIVALLLKNKAAIETYNDNGMNALHVAAIINTIEIAKLLLEKGANVNALSKGHLKATPLYHAVNFGNKEMVQLLITHGAQVDKTNSKGVLPLSIAAAKGNIEMAKLLLKNGANINKATTIDCVTALHNAVFHKKTSMITFLIKNGAKVDVETPSGKSVLDTAKETKDEDIINLVKKNILKT
jgi:ankyrin repeat protein